MEVNQHVQFEIRVLRPPLALGPLRFKTVDTLRLLLVEVNQHVQFEIRVLRPPLALGPLRFKTVDTLRLLLVELFIRSSILTLPFSNVELNTLLELQQKQSESEAVL